MISITLGPEPQILTENSVLWGEEYETALQNGHDKPPERYRRRDIRDALKAETSRKCAYCESIFEHVAYSHIEHILPKSRQPLLVCTWSNLTLACPMCNTIKNTYYDPDAPLLHPYVDDPEKEVSFYGPMAIERSAKAKLTIVTLKLNRPELLLKRHERLREVLHIMDLILASGGNRVLSKALLEELRDCIVCSSEFANCVRCFVNLEGPIKGLEPL